MYWFLLTISSYESRGNCSFLNLFLCSFSLSLSTFLPQCIWFQSSVPIENSWPAPGELLSAKFLGGVEWWRFSENRLRLPTRLRCLQPRYLPPTQTSQGTNLRLEGHEQSSRADRRQQVWRPQPHGRHEHAGESRTSRYLLNCAKTVEVGSLGMFCQVRTAFMLIKNSGKLVCHLELDISSHIKSRQILVQAGF